MGTWYKNYQIDADQLRKVMVMVMIAHFWDRKAYLITFLCFFSRSLSPEGWMKRIKAGESVHEKDNGTLG